MKDSAFSLVAWTGPILLAAAVAWAGWKLNRRGRAMAHANKGLEEAERRLEEIGKALARFAEAHGLRLPESLQELDLAPPLRETAQEWDYRPAPRADSDPRLALLVQRQAPFAVSEFGDARPARLAMLLSGKVILASSEAMDRMMQADDALRERLGLGK